MNRITFDDFEVEIGFMATCEGVVITERELHCFFMAVEHYPADIVRGAIRVALVEAGKLGQLVTPQHLKYVAVGNLWVEQARERGDLSGGWE